MTPEKSNNPEGIDIQRMIASEIPKFDEAILKQYPPGFTYIGLEEVDKGE